MLNYSHAMPHATKGKRVFRGEMALPAPDSAFLPDLRRFLPDILACCSQAVEKCNDLPLCGNSGAFSLTIRDSHPTIFLRHPPK
jgi:hypothetical protein